MTWSKKRRFNMDNPHISTRTLWARPGTKVFPLLEWGWGEATSIPGEGREECWPLISSSPGSFFLSGGAVVVSVLLYLSFRHHGCSNGFSRIWRGVQESDFDSWFEGLSVHHGRKTCQNCS